MTANELIWRPHITVAIAERDGRLLIRFAFAGTVAGHDPQRVLDHGIVRVIWLTRDELIDCTSRHRTPLVMRCIEDYLVGSRYPLDCCIITRHNSHE